MIDHRPLKNLKADDRAPLSLVHAAPADPQAVLIELSEIAQRLGAEAVHLVHLYTTGRDLIEVNRRARLHADEIHLGASGVLETIEALSKALRSAGLLSRAWGE